MTFDESIRHLFYHYGVYIYKFRYISIGSTLIVAGLLMTGIFYMDEREVDDPLFLFAPINGKSKFERKVMSEHWPLNNNTFLPGKYFEVVHWVDCVVVAADRGNILRQEYLEEIARINHYIQYNLSVEWYDSMKNKYFNFTYQELCLKYDLKCFENSHIQFLMDHSEHADLPGFAGHFAEDILQREIVVKYPTGRKAGGPIALYGSVGGVYDINEAGYFKSAKSLRLAYNTMTGGLELNEISRKWKLSLQDYLVGEKKPSTMLEFGIYHGETLHQGLRQISLTFLPDFLFSVVLLTLFACACSTVFLTQRKGIDWVRSKPFLAIIGVINSGLAIGSSFGFLIYCRMGYCDIVLVMPFLILSIGLDDMFITTAAWHRTGGKGYSIEKRVGLTMADAAVPITITSLTDFLSFLVGCITVMPIVWMFCSYTAAGILFTYIFQLTFFNPLLCIIGDMEESNRHCIFFTKTIKTNKCIESKNKGGISCSSPSKPVKNEEQGRSLMISKFFRNYYGPFLMKRGTKICVGAVYIVFLISSIWGCFNIQQGLEAKKLVNPNFYYAQYYDYMKDTFWKQGEQLQIVVNSPPDLSYEENRNLMFKMVTDFTDLEETMNENSTMFWLKEYTDLMKFYNVPLTNMTTEKFYKDIRPTSIS